MTSQKASTILDGSNLLGNLDFLNTLNEGRNLLHPQFGQQQQQTKTKQQHQQSPTPLFQPFASPSQQQQQNLLADSKLDVFAQIQQLVSSASSNGTNSDQQHQHEQQQRGHRHQAVQPLTMAFPKQQHSMAAIHNKMLSREKKKFSADVSDFLVLEVLKRKELLVENNTSRDLSFSECKRNAWNDVKELLVARFPGFDLNIEAIKSHWRYRKRKVTDVFSELCKGGDVEQKLRLRLSDVDFEIYSQLKDSNLLERTRMEVDTSPELCDESRFDGISASNSPTAKTAAANADSSSTTTSMPTLPMVSHVPFFLGPLGAQQQQQHIVGGGSTTTSSTNPTLLLERLTASLLEQQLKQHQQQQLINNNYNNSSGKRGEEEEGEEDNQHHQHGTAAPVGELSDDHDGIVSGREQRSQSASTTMSNLSGTMPAAECHPPLHHHHHCGGGGNGATKENNGDAVGNGGRRGVPAPKRLRLNEEEEEEEDNDGEEGAREEKHCGMALLKREAYMAQTSAFDEIRSLITEVRSTLLPQMLTALQNYNAQFQ